MNSSVKIMGPCTMGVGCDEAGVCYAKVNGEPEQCPVQWPVTTTDKHGRTWRPERQAWCVEGRDNEWIEASMIGDVPGDLS